MDYTPIIEEHDTNWSASIPELHVYVTGSTFSETKENAIIAAQISLEQYARAGVDAPLPVKR
jgi:predicted RNase H-like HicB family nuclease